MSSWFRTIAQFATQRKLSAGRLYNWKTKLQRWPEPCPKTKEPGAEPQKLAKLGALLRGCGVGLLSRRLA